MWKNRVGVLAAVGLGALFASEAQAISLGEFEYQNSCVQCHGIAGKGDGPFSEFMSGAVPSDISILQKNNGGVFPVTAVYSIIEGSDLVGAHGTRDMPMWGSRYRARVEADTDPNFTPAETDAYVRTRILSLIEYLASLQVE